MLGYLKIVLFLLSQSVTITPLIPAGSRDLTSISRFTVSNTTSNEITGYFEIKVFDTDANEIVVDFTTNTFHFSPHSYTVVSSDLITDIDVVSYSKRTRKEIERIGALPEGNYEICIDLIDLTGEVIAENCFEHFVEPLIPPELYDPIPESEVCIQTPIFRWSPVLLRSTSKITYKIVIVEVLDDQPPAVALEANPPLVNETVNSNSFIYSFDYPMFESGKKYAWKVEVWVNGYKLTESEPATFLFRPSG